MQTRVRTTSMQETIVQKNPDVETHKTRRRKETQRKTDADTHELEKTDVDTHEHAWIYILYVFVYMLYIFVYICIYVGICLLYFLL